MHGASGLICPADTVCMSPIVNPGELMFKLCFQQTLGSGTAEPRWLPGQASTSGRRGLTADISTHSNAVTQDAADSMITQRSQFGQNVSQALQRHIVLDSDKAVLTDVPAGTAVIFNTSSVGHFDPGADLQSSIDRIGRVALASEHRKIIQQHMPTTPRSPLTCLHYLVYVGTAGQLMQAVQVSDYVPKSTLIPLHLPHMFEQLLVYTFAVSAALALINMAPIWYLDGEAALIEIVKLRGHTDMFYSPAIQRPRVWGRLLRCVFGFGTGVFVFVFSLHVIRLFGYDAMLGHMLHTLGKLLSFVLT